jgi:hypothetical protein
MVAIFGIGTGQHCRVARTMAAGSSTSLRSQGHPVGSPAAEQAGLVKMPSAFSISLASTLSPGRRRNA